MSLHEFANVATGRDHKKFNRTQRGIFEFNTFSTRVVYGVVDTAKPLNIGIQRIHKKRIKDITSNLRKRRIRNRWILLRDDVQFLITHANDEQAISPQVQGRAQRSALSHGTVPKVFVA